jgi:hypothetical protein
MVVALLFLVVLFIGMVDMGFLVVHRFTLENAAWAGLRVGITGYDDAQVIAAIQNATTCLDSSRLTWSISPPTGDPNRASGQTLTVELWYQDRPPLQLSGIFGSTITLHVRRSGKIF